MHIPRLAVRLTIGLLTACGSAHVVTTPAPTPVAGTRIRYAIQPDTNEFRSGRLVSLDADSLVVEQLISADSEEHWVATSVATASVTRLQVHVGRRGNPALGAALGALVGGALGMACASEEGGFVTSEECLVGYTALGTGTGLLVGLLRRSDVWAPTALPERALELPPAPPITAASVSVDVPLIPLPAP